MGSGEAQAVRRYRLPVPGDPSFLKALRWLRIEPWMTPAQATGRTLEGIGVNECEHGPRMWYGELQRETRHEWRYSVMFYWECTRCHLVITDEELAEQAQHDGHIYAVRDA